MSNEQLQLAEWKVRLLLYPQYGAKPAQAVQQACEDTGLHYTTPMSKYPSSYIHGAKKWLGQEVDKVNGTVIKLMLKIEDELSQRAKGNSIF